MDNTLPFPVGQQSGSAVYANNLGQKYNSNGTWYRLCKASSALTANWVVCTAYSSGVPTWNVDSTTTANDADAVGFVPASYGTGGVTSGNYFLLQISGNITPLFAATTLTVTVALNSLGTATVAGYVQSIGTGTTAYDASAHIGWATNTAAVTAAGLAGKAVIGGLLAKD